MKSWLRLIVPGLVVFVLPHARAQLSPEKALKSFQVSRGLEISLWASEPLLVNPTCMDIDHKGRVWVCESVNYRDKLHGRPRLRRPAGDRILVLEDARGMGPADRVTVFYQAPEVLAPLGIAVAPDPDGPGCKVYVCQSPNIWLFEDKDGDCKADGPPRILLKGFGGIDHDHGVHGIVIGPDNRLYFSVGDQGVHGLQSSDGRGRPWTSNRTDCQAGTIWRCDLDGKNLELLAHNFRNEYEPCVDSFGTIFVSDNDDDGNQQTRICYVMPGGNYGYWPRGRGETHWHEEQPGVVPKILRTYFGSPTGMCMYEGGLLPPKYRNQPLHTDAGPRHLRSYHLAPDGAGYKVEREDIVQSSDNWFRPADVCVAPDGAVFMADWYDPGVGGHGMGDVTRGRIYRIAPPGNRPQVPRIDLKSAEKLRAALASPNLAVRSMAMAKLDRIGPARAVEVLDPAATQKDDAVLRARALWQLARLGRPDRLAAAFEDADPRFRLLAMRALHDFGGLTPDAYRPDWRERLRRDPSPQVRREALLLLRHAGPAKARSLILDLAAQYDGKDRFYLEAIGIAVGHHDSKRRDILLADFAKHFPGWNDTVAGLIWELRPPQQFAMLADQLTSHKIAAPQRARIVDILASSAEPNAGLILLKALHTERNREVRAALVANLELYLRGKWRQLRSSPQLAEAIRQLLTDADGRKDAVALIGAAEKAEFLDAVMKLAREERTTLPVRIAAVQALAAFKGPRATELLTRDVLPSRHTELAVEAARSLARLGTPEALEALQRTAGAPSASFSLRQTAVAGLAGTRPGTTWLLQAIADKRLGKDLTPDLARLLRNSPFPDLRNKALIVLPPPGKLDPKNLPSIPALLARRGNVNRGRDLMLATLKNEVQCLKCHTIEGTGGKVGPELTVIGSKASRENLLESILYPSRAIADQYVSWVVETRDGRAITGLLIEDAADHIVLRDANANDYKIHRKDIESRARIQTSLMPDNLLQYMPEADLVDMVEYLYSLKSPSISGR